MRAWNLALIVLGLAELFPWQVAAAVVPLDLKVVKWQGDEQALTEMVKVGVAA